MKKKWDRQNKKWNGCSIQEQARRNIQYFTRAYLNEKEIYSLINQFIEEDGLHHQFTKAFLRALKKMGKQKRKTKE